MADRKLPMTKTTLSFGLVHVPVGLVKTTDNAKSPSWDTAGPNDKPLHTETRLFNPLTGELVDEPEGDVVAEIDGETVVMDMKTDADRESPSDPLDPDAAQRAFADAAGLAEPQQKQVLVEDETNVIVEPEDVRRGIRREEGAFTDITEGLAAIDEATRLDEMTVYGAIDYGQVPRERVLGSYYLGADGPSAVHAMRYLWDAMRDRRRALVVKWTKRTGQSLGVIVPNVRKGAIEVLELAWAAQVRVPDERVTAFHNVAENPVAEEAAGTLIDAMAATAAEALDTQVDDRKRYRDELLALAAEGRQDEFAIDRAPESELAEADVAELIVESSERAAEIVKAA
ncbi:MAG: hypothetical protein LC798_13115 [Chloroflexi bacterium]|nr:hypothetical protein [Chloroflexota bacterium]